MVARDGSGSVWAGVFSASLLTWSGWTHGACIVKGAPAIAVATSRTAYIMAEDNWNSYRLNSDTPSGGFGTWTYLARIFAADPVMAACGDGSVYVVGKDNRGSLWSGRYPPVGGFQGWQPGAGILKGKPAAACGTDNVVYVAGRDNWDWLWTARGQRNNWLGCGYGGGIMNGDPQGAASGAGSIYIVLRDPGGVVWSRGYTEGTSGGWQSWTMAAGVLQDAAPAVSGGVLYITGRDLDNDRWWYRATGGQWTWIGHRGVAAGPLAAAPK